MDIFFFEGHLDWFFILGLLPIIIGGVSTIIYLIFGNPEYEEN